MPPNNGEFHYDYATREETALMAPLKNLGPSSDEGDAQKEALNNDDQPTETAKPLYHTLEEPEQNTTEHNTKDTPTVPVYNVLEGP